VVQTAEGQVENALLAGPGGEDRLQDVLVEHRVVAGPGGHGPHVVELELLEGHASAVAALGLGDLLGRVERRAGQLSGRGRGRAEHGLHPRSTERGDHH
jgi:hypothetical protein